MGIEWNYLDVALFDSLPRRDDSLQVVVEAKKMDNACLSAKAQAAGYADTRPACRRVIVTDGIRYGVYVKEAPSESVATVPFDGGSPSRPTSSTGSPSGSRP